MNHDDFIRQRVRELCEHDAAQAPAFHRVLRGKTPAASQRGSRLAWASAAAVCAIAVAMLWRVPEGVLPEPSSAAIEALEAAVEDAPSDALLAGGDFDDASALSREINAMLNR